MNFFETLSYKVINQIRKKRNWLNFILGSTDIFSLLVTFQVSFAIMNKSSDTIFLFNSNYLLLFLYMIPIWILMLQACNIAQIPRTGRINKMFMEFMQFSFMNVIILFVFNYVFRLDTGSYYFLVLVGIVGLVLLFSLRLIEYKMFKWYRAHGYNYINVVLIADES